jgi:competence protein ComEC
VDAVLDPRLPAESPDQNAALREARRRRVPVLVARAGDVYRLGRLRLRVLWPDGPGSPGEDPNRRAVVLLASYGSIDALLTADAESEVTLPLRPPPVEILKVAHHGSADTRLPDLLRRVRPRIAVISVGRRNDYGHPTRTTLSALEAAPALDLYRTDRDGRVTLESSGGRLVIHRER